MAVKKRNKANKPPEPEQELSSVLREPEILYGKLRSTTAWRDIKYTDFKKVADKAPFTQAEWAGILHVSERTLQRYAKDNHLLAPINAERLVLIENVIEQGTITFGKAEKFYSWLKRDPYMLEGNLSMKSLTSFEGIQNVLTQLGRIQHGIFA